jgi:LEA14-like dessication related protein
MPRLPYRDLAAAVAAATLVGACALAQTLRFERPTVELDAIQITGLGLSGGSLNLMLDVFNPNSYDLRTMRIEAGIDLEGTHFGDVMLERDVLLPANEHAVLEVPVAFTWAGLGAGARGLLGRGAVNYTMESRIAVGTPIGDRTVALRSAGLVPLKELLP